MKIPEYYGNKLLGFPNQKICTEFGAENFMPKYIRFYLLVFGIVLILIINIVVLEKPKESSSQNDKEYVIEIFEDNRPRVSMSQQKACMANMKILLTKVAAYNDQQNDKMSELDQKKLVEKAYLHNELKCPSVNGNAYVGFNLADGSQLSENSIICLYHGSILNPVDLYSIGTDYGLLKDLPPDRKVIYKKSIFSYDNGLLILLAIKWIVFPLILYVLLYAGFNPTIAGFSHSLYLTISISPLLTILFPAAAFFDMFVVYDIMLAWLMAIMILIFSPARSIKPYRAITLIIVFGIPPILFIDPMMLIGVSIGVFIGEIIVLLDRKFNFARSK